MSNSEAGSSSQRLPQEVDRLLTLMRHEANSTVHYLDESRERPVRHNMGLERTALWHAVALEAHCEKAVDRDLDFRVLPISPEVGSPVVRYDVEAGILMIPRLLPFTNLDLPRLRAASEGTYPEGMAEREPELVARWHRWLWESPQNVEGSTPSGTADYGGSSELALASSRLASGLKVVLGESIT